LGQLSLSPPPNAVAETTSTERLLIAGIKPGTKEWDRARLIDNILRPLEIIEEGPKLSVEQCLLNFMAVDILEGSNGLACEKCNGTTNPSRTPSPALSNTSANCSSLPNVSVGVQQVISPKPVSTYGVNLTPINAAQRVGSPLSATSSDDVRTEANGSDGAAEALLRDTNKTASTLHESEGPRQNAADSNVQPTASTDKDHETEVRAPIPQVFISNDALLSRSTSPATPPPDATARTRSRTGEKILTKGFKRFLVYSYPEILVIHLKRFQQVGMSGRTRKVEDSVSFSEILDLEPFIAPADIVQDEKVSQPNDVLSSQSSQNSHSSKNDDLKPPAGSLASGQGKYRLLGIVVHSGSLFGGHYVAYVNIAGFGQPASWIYASDTHVRISSWEEVSKAQAYLLFYERLRDVT
jgi:hypothetical protein